MTNSIHPAAPHHLPVFITAPGESDVFLIGCAIFLILAIVGLGSLYFRLHALPEHLAHGNANKRQFEVVSVLALLALFTHNNWFWIGALLLALVPIPDIYAPLAAMAESLAKMARRGRPTAETPPSAAPADVAWTMPPAGSLPPVPSTMGGNHDNGATYRASSNRDQTPSGSAATGKRPHPELKETLES